MKHGTKGCVWYNRHSCATERHPPQRMDEKIVKLQQYCLVLKLQHGIGSGV